MFTKELLLIKDDFKNLIRQDRLGQGYIFFGSALNAIEDLAYWLARQLEKDAKVFLDAKFIDSFDSIGIDQVREIKNFLWQKPLRSSRKTLIIKNAEKLTNQAQNALLKVAEEPPAHGLIILVVEKLENLLPTILSRFQKIGFYGHDNPINEASRVEAIKFLRMSKKEKTDFMKDLIAAESDLGQFVQAAMLELDKNPIKNLRQLKSLLDSWKNIRQYNTNKRLQLEAWIESFPY